MSVATVIWTAAALAFGAFAGAAGGHPPGVVAAPFLAVLWLVVAGAFEAIANTWRPRRSPRVTLVVLAATVTLVLALPFTSFLFLGEGAGGGMNDQVALVLGIGPLSALAAAVCLIQLRRGRLAWPRIHLPLSAGLWATLAWFVDWLPFAAALAAIAVLQAFGSATVWAQSAPAIFTGAGWRAPT